MQADCIRREKQSEQIGSRREWNSESIEKIVRAQKGRRDSQAGEIAGLPAAHKRAEEECAFSSSQTKEVSGAKTIRHDKSSMGDDKVAHQRRRRRHRHPSSQVEQHCLLKNLNSIAPRSRSRLALKGCLLLVLLTALVIFITRDHHHHHHLHRDSIRISDLAPRGWPASVQCANVASNTKPVVDQPNQQKSPPNPLQKQALKQATTRIQPSPSSAVPAQKAKAKASRPTLGTSSAVSTVKAAASNKATTLSTASSTTKPKLLSNVALRRTPHSSSSSSDSAQDLDNPNVGLSQQQPAQISITPRVSHIRVPVDSNTLLKCLISSSSSPLSSSSASSSSSGDSKLNQKLDIRWSRFMYDENVFEQLDTSPLIRPHQSKHEDEESSSIVQARSHSAAAAATSSQSEQATDKPPFDRQQQLRDFLARSRQETNVISDLLIEATLSINGVQASDNASYYCTATDNSGGGPAEQNQARIDLVSLSRPIVQLERVHPARDSKSALIHWLVLSDGNTPIKKTILMVRNDTNGRPISSQRPLPPGLVQEPSATASSDATDYYESSTSSQFSSVVIDSNYNQWQRIEIPDERLDMQDEAGGSADLTVLSPYDHPLQAAGAASSGLAAADVDVTSPLGSGGQQPDSQAQDYYANSRVRWQSSAGHRTSLLSRRRQRAFNLTALLPGVTYNFRLAAINDMGQSEWSYLTATMPNEIPAQISEMFLLSRSNDSLAIGWRRPAYDGAKTIRYEMQLFDLNRTLTLDANTNTTAGSQKTNFMYIFVSLNPGTDYHFHVRACSRAGCSAYSSPKLLASTLDGEPDEPLEVELSCEPESGNVSVSWLPPAHARGQLLNYSVSFDSRVSYRNQSGHLRVDEWRSSMETQDNQTLSLEAGGILLPNTNYSVRVCANNRSKHCGRLSQLTPRSQCSTPPELPGELPPGLQLEKTSAGSSECLQLGLPFISARNGSLSCIQVVLIRLPDSFAASGGSLKDFLPEQPDDVTLSRYVMSSPPVSAAQQQQSQNDTSERFDADRALAYLAEEINPSTLLDNRRVDGQQVDSASPTKVILLGDGRHEQCQMRQSETIARPEVFDGPLKARAFYTGFVKLILVRPGQLKSKYHPTSEPSAMKRRASASAQEILTKYSGYFEAVQMGDNVLQLQSDESGRLATPNGDLRVSTPFGAAGAGDGADLMAAAKLRPLQEMASELGQNVKKNFGKFYKLASNYVAENLRLDFLGDFIRKSSPLMQLFEVGTVVIVISLLLLFIVYLITLPTRLARRRKRKIKRQLQKHQQEAAAANQLQQQQQQQFDLGQMVDHKSPVASGQMVFASAAAPVSLLDQQQGIEYRPVGVGGATDQPEQQTAYPSPPPPVSGEQLQPQHKQPYGAPNRECPIHSSPANSNNSASRQQAATAAHQHRQAAVHVCQPVIVYGNNQRASSGDADEQYCQHQEAMRQQQEQYERNCRTTRRQHHQQYVVGGGGGGGQQPADMRAPPTGARGQFLTLSQGQQSVLALAKKINKSIPLRLFRGVLECRLRNGWLKEEYEQLPSLPLFPQEPNQKISAQDTCMRLRPQLIVSRNDSMSALISGNDQYDASLVSFAIPSAAAAANGSSFNLGTTTGLRAGKRIICAKSPLDADSVWDFWRLVYEQEVGTIVMLTQNEDANTGELRCAQYWPTCDNEETTILSPCNEFVQKSTIPPAKFKIRQETLEEETAQDGFMVRRLTLMVMATRPGENEQQDGASSLNGADTGQKRTDQESSTDEQQDDDRDDDEKYVIIQRDILQLQFHCWNTSNLANQLRLITFIRRANERHLVSLKMQQQQQQQADDTMVSPHRNANNPMLVHCFNGLGRSGVFAGLSLILDDLALKLHFERLHHQEQQLQQKLNLFQLVSKMRIQREMIISPYRFYELLYQLTANCIPQEINQQPLEPAHTH